MFRKLISVIDKFTDVRVIEFLEHTYILQNTISVGLHDPRISPIRSLLPKMQATNLITMNDNTLTINIKPVENLLTRHILFSEPNRRDHWLTMLLNKPGGGQAHRLGLFIACHMFAEQQDIASNFLTRDNFLAALFNSDSLANDDPQVITSEEWETFPDKVPIITGRLPVSLPIQMPGRSNLTMEFLTNVSSNLDACGLTEVFKKEFGQDYCLRFKFPYNGVIVDPIKCNYLQEILPKQQYTKPIMRLFANWGETPLAFKNTLPRHEIEDQLERSLGRYVTNWDGGKSIPISKYGYKFHGLILNQDGAKVPMYVPRWEGNQYISVSKLIMSWYDESFSDTEARDSIDYLLNISTGCYLFRNKDTGRIKGWITYTNDFLPVDGKTQPILIIHKIGMDHDVDNCDRFKLVETLISILKNSANPGKDSKPPIVVTRALIEATHDIVCRHCDPLSENDRDFRKIHAYLKKKYSKFNYKYKTRTGSNGKPSYVIPHLGKGHVREISRFEQESYERFKQAHALEDGDLVLVIGKAKAEKK